MKNPIIRCLTPHLGFGSAFLVLFSVISASALVERSASAFEHGGGGHFVHGRGHEGHWVHDRHAGRLGWWWVVGPAWHFYARPYYPVHETVIVEQQPPVTVVQAPPAAAPVFYYCKATGTYYPDTMTCPGGWSTLNAKTPPDLAQGPS